MSTMCHFSQDTTNIFPEGSLKTPHHGVQFGAEIVIV